MLSEVHLYNYSKCRAPLYDIVTSKRQCFFSYPKKPVRKLTVLIMTGCSNAISAMKCCRTPSCPNLQHNNAKYTPSATPETFTGVSSESSSPVHSAATGTVANTASNHLCSMLGQTIDTQFLHHDRGNEFLIEALKSRIELQQRKLLAMELEGKGRDTLTIEIEKLEERCSAIEAQNIRLEAKNLQLQLDNDLLKQGDSSDRLQKRIKHLEDYIIALKEEMAAAETRSDLCNCIAQKKMSINNYSATQQQHLEHKNSADQTILSLRNIVDKLRAENKYLKESRRATDVTQASMEQLSTQLKTLKKKYANAVEKISQMNAELLVKPKCPICSAHSKTGAHGTDELKFIKEQLTKKTQLLQKAKVLLTRAAAKEKVLKEQVALWKRKCSELQNVPVIEEISE